MRAGGLPGIHIPSPFPVHHRGHRGGGGGVRQAGDPQGGAGNRGTGSDVNDSIPGRRNSGNHIPGMPVLAWIHYNLPYMKY
jgi:hypothetical protein